MYSDLLATFKKLNWIVGLQYCASLKYSKVSDSFPLYGLNTQLTCHMGAI